MQRARLWAVLSVVTAFSFQAEGLCSTPVVLHLTSNRNLMPLHPCDCALDLILRKILYLHTKNLDLDEIAYRRLQPI
jgi:hypothetical protein